MAKIFAHKIVALLLFGWFASKVTIVFLLIYCDKLIGVTLRERDLNSVGTLVDVGLSKVWLYHIIAFMAWSWTICYKWFPFFSLPWSFLPISPFSFLLFFHYLMMYTIFTFLSWRLDGYLEIWPLHSPHALTGRLIDFSFFKCESCNSVKQNFLLFISLAINKSWAYLDSNLVYNKCSML